MCRIIAICILYNPHNSLLQMWRIIVNNNRETFFCFVDNSNFVNRNFQQIPNSCYLPNKANLGIAAAQNVGIEYAKKNGFEHIVFFDQDTEVPRDYCKSILNEYLKIKQTIDNLCMVGPIIVNKENGNIYKNDDPSIDADYSIASVLISTGTLVEIGAMSRIGKMDESLFIDGVDFEWCWRAKSMGYCCARTHNVYLPHKVGGKDCSFGGYPIIISAPIRYFYQYRNYLILIRRRYVPFSWKVKSGIRKLFELLLVPIFAESSKLQILKYMLKGIAAGLKY